MRFCKEELMPFSWAGVRRMLCVLPMTTGAVSVACLAPVGSLVDTHRVLNSLGRRALSSLAMRCRIFSAAAKDFSPCEVLRAELRDVISSVKAA